MTFTLPSPSVPDVRRRARRRATARRALATLAPLAFSTLLGSCDRTPPVPPAPRVMLLAVDGADWTVIDLLIADGALPTWERVLREGAHGTLRTIEPIFSPVVWATVSTGQPPEVHGIQSFTVPVDGKPIPVTSNLVRAPRLWDMLSSRNRTVGVIGWWTTWPATPVDGFLVSERTWPITFSEHGMPVTSHEVPELDRRTYPETLYDGIASEIVTRRDLSRGSVAEATRVDVSGPLGTVDNRGPSVADVYAKDLTFVRMARRLVPSVRPDFFTLYLELPDVMAHYFWDSWRYSRWARFGEPTRWTDPPKNMPPDFAQYVGENFERAFRFVDDTLAELIAMADDSTTIVIVSDHGYGENESGEKLHIGDGLHAANPHWHRLEGILAAWGYGVAPGAEVDGSVYDVVPTLLYAMGEPIGEDLQGDVLTGLFEPGFVRRPAVTAPPYRLEASPEDALPVSSGDDEAYRELLRSLGYLD